MTDTLLHKTSTGDPQAVPEGTPHEPPPARARSTGPESATAVTTKTHAKDLRKAALLRFAISISVLNVIGHLVLGFEQAPIVPITAVLVAYVTSIVLETIDAWARKVRPAYVGGPSEMFYFLLPAHIAALACAMLIYGQSTGIYLFAVVVAVGSKYLFRVTVKGRPRHFLNPSNFGISVTLLLMPTVGFVPPYMFLNNVDGAVDWLIPAVVLIAGTMLNAKLTRRMPLILAWVGGYVVQALMRSVFFDDHVWAALGMMTGVAFVLFTNYMITDPGTTPMSTKGQVVFGLTTAFVYGVLIVTGVAYAIFFALIITCALRGLLMWVSERKRIRAANREGDAAPALVEVVR